MRDYNQLQPKCCVVSVILDSNEYFKSRVRNNKEDILLQLHLKCLLIFSNKETDNVEAKANGKIGTATLPFPGSRGQKCVPSVYRMTISLGNIRSGVRKRATHLQ